VKELKKLKRRKKSKTKAQKKKDDRKKLEEMGKKFPLKILVVEDNSVNQKVIKRMLLHYGYECQIANDGLEALELVQKELTTSSPIFNLVFMDLQMPRMGGIESCSKIRALLQPHQQPRIVALTANVLPKEQEMCLEAGMDDFVSKPVEINCLYNALSRAISINNQAPKGT